MVKTDALKSWAVSLIICAVGATVISMLSPRGSMEKTLRAVIGIFVVSAICTPLIKLKKADVSLPAFIAEAVTLEETEKLLEQMKNACKETVGRVVDDELRTFEIGDYDVETILDIDEDNCIIIQSVQIVIKSKNNGAADEIKEKLQERLGIPVEVICE